MKSKNDKHNERANRQILDVKESKFNIYGYKNVILNMYIIRFIKNFLTARERFYALGLRVISR
jgi:hypothetical protein